MLLRDHLAAAIQLHSSAAFQSHFDFEERDDNNAPSQSNPRGIASTNASAIEQGMVLSPSLPPRAARSAPSLGGPRAVLSLGQRGRQRSDRQADRPM